MVNNWLSVVSSQLDLAGILLVALIAVVIWTLVLAQRDPAFDIKQALMNDDGKVSFLRLASLGSFAFSSWALMKVILNFTEYSLLYGFGYIALWGGMPLGKDFMDALKAKWSR